MTDLEILLAVAGAVVTCLVVAGMILITPGGQVPVEGEHHRGVDGGARTDGRPPAVGAGSDASRP